jgi:hypothetical protein
MIDQQHLQPALAGLGGAEQPGRTGPQDHGVKVQGGGGVGRHGAVQAGQGRRWRLLGQVRRQAQAPLQRR